MTNLMQRALGPSWNELPPALQRHYQPGTTVDVGHMDIEFPAFMLPVLWVISHLGVLVRRRGRDVATRVTQTVAGDRQHWQRNMRFADGQSLRFDSVWERNAQGHVVEFVNAFMGLEMKPFVVGQQLHYEGVRFVLRLGRVRLPVPEWLALGHTTIVEEAVDEQHFRMDFRLIHPLFGQVFRYAGVFKSGANLSG
jgi:hypothetical protein